MYCTVSGGKDGSYVSAPLKTNIKSTLLLSCKLTLSLEIGDQNLTNLLIRYSHIHITPNPSVLSLINKLGFIHMGFLTTDG